MIPFDIVYVRPGTVREAADAYRQLDADGQAPVYYGGGSELISMARLGNAAFGAVIDLKSIPECRVLETDGDSLLLGSAVTLGELVRSGLFPLLGKTAGRIADRTMQNRITLGGNLAATIIYRETVLPLLLSDAALTTAGIGGLSTQQVSRLFRERLMLPKGDFMVRAAVGLQFAGAPYFHVKKTKNEKIDYPLLTAAALVAGGALRIAFSGLAAYPFRDAAVEKLLNDGRLGVEERAGKVCNALSGIILEDTNASAAYRLFVLKNTVATILNAIKEEHIPCSC